MSDATTTETTTEKSKRVFDVNYTLEIVDELPPSGHVGGTGSSPLNQQVDKVKAKVNEDPSAAGKWMLIGRYGKSTAASASANVLRQRFGRSMEADGLEFATRPIDGGAARGLFVRYDGSKIVPGALEEHRRNEKARLAELKAKREAAKSNGESGTEGGNDNKAAAEKAKAAAAKAAAK